jgi:hypothetical protein
MFVRFRQLLFAVLLATDLRAAEFIFVNGDGENEGLNDPTVVAPVGGNPGTTLGAQRLAALQRVGEIWGGHLASPVPISVLVGFDSLTANILAGAAPVSEQQNFANAPKQNVWYPIALANALAGVDFEPGSSDITVTANANAAFYYGLDTATPPGSYNFVDVLLHELGHGLGFISFISGSNGNLFAGQIDIFSSFIYDQQQEAPWSALTAAQRVSSAKNDPFLVWTGPFTNAGLPSKMAAQSGVGGFRLTATLPGPITQFMPNAPASITPTFPNNGLSGELAVTDVGTVPAGGPNGACGAIINSAQIAGKIAFVRRGTCTFAEKIYNAQLAGAIAVVIANNVSPGVIVAGGNSSFNGVPLAIPAIMVSQQDGDTLLAASPEVQLSFTPVPNQFIGTYGNQLRLHAPTTFASGSSISHWTTESFPNLLMEPSINSNLDRELDLTLTQLKDIGWKVIDIPFPHLTYDSWKLLAFLDGDTLTNPADDPDADGVSNQEEYFFGMNPKVPDPAKLPGFEVANGHADLVFTRSKLTTDLAWSLEKSTALDSFQPAVAGVDYQILSTVSLGTDAEEITLRLLNPPAELFIRLRITR